MNNRNYIKYMINYQVNTISGLLFVCLPYSFLHKTVLSNRLCTNQTCIIVRLFTNEPFKFNKFPPEGDFFTKNYIWTYFFVFHNLWRCRFQKRRPLKILKTSKRQLPLLSSRNIFKKIKYILKIRARKALLTVFN